MTRISQQHIATALTKVKQLSSKEKEGLADELFVAQPNLLASVLALSISNVSMKDIEVALNILFACFEAVRVSGPITPMISEEVQDLCLARIVAHASFADGLPAVLQTHVGGDSKLPVFGRFETAFS